MGDVFIGVVDGRHRRVLGDTGVCTAEVIVVGGRLGASERVDGVRGMVGLCQASNLVAFLVKELDLTRAEEAEAAVNQLVNGDVFGVRVGTQNQPFKNKRKEEDRRRVVVGMGLEERALGLAMGFNEADQDVEECSEDIELKAEENLGNECLAKGGGRKLVIA